MKIDTQGMSFGSEKSGGKSLQEQRDAIPPMVVNKTNLLSDALKKELKELMHEVLEEYLGI
jgi:hypothetical protein|tara:strand:+ start:19 stop:201 length:183 start_codon:yes stop_codon:yes gene_type:complete